MTELNDMQRLVVATAAEKAIKTLTAPNNPDSLRARVDAEMRSAWERDGTTQRKVSINGRSLATYSVRTKPAEVVDELSITNPHAFLEWLTKTDDGYNLLWTYALSVQGSRELLKCAMDVMVVDGVIPDGCRVHRTEYPERWAGTTMRGCKPHEVAEALGNALPETIAEVIALPE